MRNLLLSLAEILAAPTQWAPTTLPGVGPSYAAMLELPTSCEPIRKRGIRATRVPELR